MLLAAALMESFAIRIDVCADPEYAAVEGFVLDPRRRAIVANWVDADGIWHVGVTTDRPTIRGYHDITGHARAGLAEPRSRLLSITGVDRACRYLGELGNAGG